MRLACRVEEMEAALQQLEERGKDRAVALRAILRDDKEMDKLLSQNYGQLPVGCATAGLSLSTSPSCRLCHILVPAARLLQPDHEQQPWDSYRARQVAIKVVGRTGRLCLVVCHTLILPPSLLPCLRFSPALAGCSFTLALSKTYIRAVDGLRNRLMVTEWELGLRPIALQM